MKTHHGIFIFLQQFLLCFCMHTGEGIEPRPFRPSDIARLYQTLQEATGLGMGSAQDALIDSIIDYLNPTGAPLGDMTAPPTLSS